MHMYLAGLNISQIVSIGKGLPGGYQNFQLLDAEQQEAVLKFRSLHTLADQKACKAVVFEAMPTDMASRIPWKVTEVIYQNCDTQVYHVNSPASFCEALEHSTRLFQQPINILSLQGHANSMVQDLGYLFFGRKELPCMDQHLARDAQVLSLGCNTNTKLTDVSIPLATFLANSLPGRSVLGISSYLNTGLAYSSFNGQKIDFYHWFPLQEGDFGSGCLESYLTLMLISSATAILTSLGLGAYAFISAKKYAYNRLLHSPPKPPTAPHSIPLREEHISTPSYVLDKAGRVKVEKISVHGTEHILMLSSENRPYIYFENQKYPVERSEKGAEFSTEFGEYSVPIVERHLAEEDLGNISEFTTTPEGTLTRARSGANIVLHVMVDGIQRIAGVKTETGYTKPTSVAFEPIMFEAVTWEEALNEKNASNQSVHQGIRVSDFIIWQGRKCPLWANRRDNFFAVEVFENQYALAQRSSEEIVFTVDDVSHIATIYHEQFDQDLVNYWRSAPHLIYDSNSRSFECEICTLNDEIWDVLRKEDSVALRGRKNGYLKEVQTADEGARLFFEGDELVVSKENYPWTRNTTSGLMTADEKGMASRSYIGFYYPIVQVPCINAGPAFVIRNDRATPVDPSQKSVKLDGNVYTLINESIDLHTQFQNATDRQFHTNGNITTEMQTLVSYQDKLFPLIYDRQNAKKTAIRVTEDQILVTDRVSPLLNHAIIGGKWYPTYTISAARHKSEEFFDRIDPRDWGECEGGVKANTPFLTPLCSQSGGYFFRKYKGNIVVQKFGTDQSYVHKEYLKRLRSVELQSEYLSLHDLAEFTTAYLPYNNTEILHTTTQTDLSSYEVLWVHTCETPEVVGIRNTHGLIPARQTSDGKISVVISDEAVELEIINTRCSIRDTFSGASFDEDSFSAAFIQFEEGKCPIFTLGNKVAVSINGALIFAYRSSHQHLTFWYNNRYYNAPIQRQSINHALTEYFKLIRNENKIFMREHTIVDTKPFTAVHQYGYYAKYAEIKPNGELFLLEDHSPQFLGSINDHKWN
ncbi:MAG: hypothetical protein Q8K75_12380 [Chlamydiales bacterium]|nr:hypothetical protein [Chlamydiales bacterium]